ncbi:hypothetical protein [Sinorhizobium psoraleae]|uniref:Uncharacterized protein n=1 Tax=Sinorhizobium psoraleae TaxID=520838 RepID=A0ABT4KAR7_9HYPH|nr:hypothetical protein [Sinorhizobium psoraleae]MCZ4089065.1 hypothetical protein [Sinorhizobium psoraleae]
MNDETYDCEYASSPDDTFGLNPTIRQWLADNPEFPIQPYTPPTAEQIRAGMPKLTARQFRLGFVNAGHSLASIDAAIAAIPDAMIRDVAQIEWQYATTFERLHPLISQIGTGLGLDDAAIDAMWTAAQSL